MWTISLNELPATHIFMTFIFDGDGRAAMHYALRAGNPVDVLRSHNHEIRLLKL